MNAGFPEPALEPFDRHPVGFTDPGDRVGRGRADVDVSAIEMEIGCAVRQIRSRTTKQDRVASTHVVVGKCVGDGCRAVGVPDDGDVLGRQAVMGHPKTVDICCQQSSALSRHPRLADPKIGCAVRRFESHPGDHGGVVAFGIRGQGLVVEVDCVDVARHPSMRHAAAVARNQERGVSRVVGVADCDRGPA